MLLRKWIKRYLEMLEVVIQRYRTPTDLLLRLPSKLHIRLLPNLHRFAKKNSSQVDSEANELTGISQGVGTYLK